MTTKFKWLFAIPISTITLLITLWNLVLLAHLNWQADDLAKSMDQMKKSQVVIISVMKEMIGLKPGGEK